MVSRLIAYGVKRGLRLRKTGKIESIPNSSKIRDDLPSGSSFRCALDYMVGEVGIIAKSA